MNDLLHIFLSLTGAALGMWFMQRLVMPTSESKDRAGDGPTVESDTRLGDGTTARTTARTTGGTNDGATVRTTGETISRMRPQSWLADAIAAFAGVGVASLALLLTARPIASCLLSWGLSALLILLNRAKERELREPLVLADIYLVAQIIFFPHLYLPFLPLKRLTGLFILVLLTTVALISLEPSLPLARSLNGIIFLSTLVLLNVVPLAAMHFGYLHGLAAWLLQRCPVSHDPMADSMRNGPLASALLHPVRMGQILREKPEFMSHYGIRPAEAAWPLNFMPSPDSSQGESPDEKAAGRQPHVLIIQAESFCDIRKTIPGLEQANLLPNWDNLSPEEKNIPLPVTAFGAYTMRAEFSMLTGLPAAALGPWAFNPYLLAAGRPLWSLPRYFADRGYDTLCLHPYAKNFFRRDLVMPNLGFSRFLGEQDLPELQHFGPYVSDKALGEIVLQEISASKKPLFCFVITMEAHGPWLPGRLPGEQVQHILERSAVTREDFAEEVQYYLCHLKHMDDMIGQVKTGLIDIARMQRPGRLTVYGDHAPNLRTNF